MHKYKYMHGIDIIVELIWEKILRVHISSKYIHQNIYLWYAAQL